MYCDQWASDEYGIMFRLPYIYMWIVFTHLIHYMLGCSVSVSPMGYGNHLQGIIIIWRANNCHYHLSLCVHGLATMLIHHGHWGIFGGYLVSIIYNKMLHQIKIDFVWDNNSDHSYCHVWVGIYFGRGIHFIWLLMIS